MIRVVLTPQVSIEAVDENMLAVDVDGHRMNLVGLKEHGAFLAKLQQGPIPWDDLPRLGNGTIDPEVAQAVHMLATRSLIELDCVDGAQCLLSASAVAGSQPIVFWSPEQGECYLLSKFAYLRRSGTSLVLESGRARWLVTLHHPALATVIAATATTAASLDNVLQASAGLEAEAVTDCLLFLISVGAILPVNDRAEPDEQRIPELAQREFHDVLMHAESRRGLAPQPIGGMFPFAGKFEPTKAIRDRASETIIGLPKPDLAEIRHKDMPLAQAMEDRRSVRRFADRPLPLEDLGEFLYRVGRIRAVRNISTDDPRHYEMTRRTYPSGGASYDLEIYVTAWNCAGLSQAMYHYDPAEHVLSLVTDRQSTAWRIVRDAYISSGNKGVPHVVLTLASRFTRLSWKYRGIAYATTLKNVGVLYEAMYLAATAMGLGPCGLGGGNVVVFSEATRLDPLVESSVGEFMLGIPADQE